MLIIKGIVITMAHVLIELVRITPNQSFITMKRHSKITNKENSLKERYSISQDIMLQCEKSNVNQSKQKIKKKQNRRRKRRRRGRKKKRKKRTRSRMRRRRRGRRRRRRRRREKRGVQNLEVHTNRKCKSVAGLRYNIRNEGFGTATGISPWISSAQKNILDSILFCCIWV